MNPVKILLPFGLLLVFVCWVLYRLIIKKDLRQHLPGLYAGVLFIAIWTVIYVWLKQ